jgi:predicted transposase YdaD
MKQSEQVLEWMAEGRAEGRVEGRAEGEIKGRMEGKRQSLLRLLNRRFSAGAGAELTERIQSMTKEDTLDHWLDAIGTANSLEDFQRLVEQNGG